MEDGYLSASTKSYRATGKSDETGKSVYFRPKNRLMAQESKYIAGLSSKNIQYKNRCIFFLGSLRSNRAVLPLMKILRSSSSESSRILAAYSLMKIDNIRGVFLVKRLGFFEKNETVGHICNLLFEAYEKGELTQQILERPVFNNYDLQII